jgi:hypothetical protein
MRFRMIPVLLAGAALALTLTACESDGTGGVATAASGNAAKPTSSTGIELADNEAQLKFAKCMREQGVDMEDPQSDGGTSTIQLPRGSTQAEREKILAAAEECKSHLPNGGAGLDLDQEQVDKIRTLAQCMRANGYPEFPDPDSAGRVQLPAGTDPEDPRLKQALSKCREFTPDI